MMKRFLCFILIILSLLFSACDPGHLPIAQESLQNVTSVELISYENQQQKHFLSWVPNHFDELAPFDHTLVTILETLPEEKVDDFLQSFSETEILHTYYAYDSPKGICIRVNYTDGHFLIIWANYFENSFAGYIGEYLPDGTVLSFWGSFSGLFYYTDLVNLYFDCKI